MSVYASDVIVGANSIGGTGSFYNGIELDCGPFGCLSQVSVTANSVAIGPNADITYSSSIGDLGMVNGLVVTDNVLTRATTGIRIDTCGTPPPVVSGNVITGATHDVSSPC